MVRGGYEAAADARELRGSIAEVLGKTIAPPEPPAVVNALVTQEEASLVSGVAEFCGRLTSCARHRPNLSSKQGGPVLPVF